MTHELPYRITFALLMLALFVLRMRWHIQARIHDPGAVSPDEGWATRAMRILTLPVWFMVVGAWLLFGVSWLQAELPAAVRWLGAWVALGGLGLLGWVHHHLGQNFSPYLRIRHDHTLVTSGPYARVRHPMYTAFLLVLGGFAVLSANGFLAAAFLIMMGALLFHRLPREEAMLKERFGAEYEAWRTRTGLLVPRMVA